MDKVLFWFKTCFAVVSSLFVSAVGGADELFCFLMILMVSDIVTGIIKAVITKKMSSTSMRVGLLRKLLVIIAVMICCYGDKVITANIGHPIMLGNKEWYIRNICILFFIFEEVISLVENLAEAGLPIPKWLRSVLVKLNDTATGNSTPKFIVDFVKKVFGVDVSDKKEDKPKVEDTSEDNEKASNKDEN